MPQADGLPGQSLCCKRNAGLGGKHTAVPMAVLMIGCTALSMVGLLLAQTNRRPSLGGTSHDVTNAPNRS